MIKFALTGGIACGKSTVSRRWAQQGLDIIDADVIAHQVLTIPTVMDEIVKLVGVGVLKRGEHGEVIDRQILGKVVFERPDVRDQINDIVHPRVRWAVDRRFHELEIGGTRLVCYDVPLLFEAGLASLYSPIVVVKASENVQLMRLMERNMLDEEQAWARINAQMSQREKVSRADYVIDNSGTIEETHRQCDIVLTCLRGYRC